MRRLLLTLVCLSLLSTGAFAQTAGSGGLVAFETFTSSIAANRIQASLVAGPMTSRSVFYATGSGRLSRNLGVGIANPGSTTASMTFTLRRGTTGNIVAAKTLRVGARQQVAKFIAEIFSDVPELPLDFEGTVTLVSDTPVSLMALRFRGTNYSTTPITQLSQAASVPQVSPGVGGPGALIFPQFATGTAAAPTGNWLSEIALINTNILPLNVRIDLFKQDGSPLTTTLNTVSGSTFQNLVIPGEGLLIEDNTDNSPLRSGYAIVTPLDTIRPTVTSTVPANAEIGVPITQRAVTAVFSEVMDTSTINATTFTLRNGLQTNSGAVTYAGRTATFTATSNFALDTLYTGTITTGAMDLFGNALASDYVWTFRTRGIEPDPIPGGGVPPPAGPSGPATVDLGVAAPYAILAGSGVANTGGTIINGKLGSSPAGAINGFPPGVVTGGTDFNNPAAEAAKLALTAAYNDAAGRSVNVIALPAGLDGLTLAPGLYSNAISAELSSGGKLYLDGGGNANATWIFQLGSTLKFLSGSEIVLSGDAQAKNIFWKVGSSATIGTTAIVKGNILADQAITAETGAVITGRLLTRIAAVTLDANVVTIP